uniref:BPTI/Kunitz inhibitor domain-containing protein n=1 Tax=Acanthochromis polyacanthus TaxID=80966 RepID=A0A3Q1EVF6_9TELE
MTRRFWFESLCVSSCSCVVLGVLSLKSQIFTNYVLMWFYDSKQGKCSRFWYGGCGGNENRFTTQKECENLCVRSQ